MMEIMSSEEFIDMEVSLSPCSSSSSPSTQYRGDFEFPLITSSSSQNYFNSQLDHQINSADELFYQGKLLPLLQLKNFINIPNNYYHHIIPTSTNPNTPPDSCRVSCDNDRENESFVEWSNEVKGFTHHTQPKKRPNNWPKRLLYKLKSSRAYLFFAKSATCSNLMEANNNKEKLSFEKKGRNNNNNKRVPLKDLLFESHRKSFSGAISATASLSSSSSSSSTPSLVLNSNGGRVNDFQVLKRSRSADPELESFIQGAIAHCKLSQK